MSEFSFLLNSSSRDYTINSAGRIVISYPIDTVKDRIYTRMYTELGEWYLDNTVGVPYYGDDGILGSKKQADEIGSILRAQILGVDGVVRINTFTINFNNRQLRVQSSVVVLIDGTEQLVEVSL